MALDRTLISAVRALDEYDLRRLLIVLRGLLVQHDGPDIAGPEKQITVTYRQESVRCGKSGCTKCPHGPYWYGYWREDGKLRSRYIGRELDTKLKTT